jgi:hypothetical protein
MEYHWLAAARSSPHRHAIENRCQVRNIGDMERSLEQMARSLAESGDYRVISRLEPQAEYHPPSRWSPKAPLPENAGRPLPAPETSNAKRER